MIVILLMQKPFLEGFDVHVDTFDASPRPIHLRDQFYVGNPGESLEVIWLF